MEVNPNENTQRLFIQSFVKQRNQLPSLVFWQNQRQAEEGWWKKKLCGGKEGRLQLFADWKLLTLESCIQVTSSWAIYVIG